MQKKKKKKFSKEQSFDFCFVWTSNDQGRMEDRLQGSPMFLLTKTAGSKKN